MSISLCFLGMYTSVQKEVKQEIMATDIYVEIVDEQHTKNEIEADIDLCFDIFQAFEQRFSRFRNDNELSAFNACIANECHVSEDLLEMLLLAQTFYTRTNGVFDISMLPYLEEAGYTQSALKGFTNTQPPLTGETPVVGIDTLVIDQGRGVVKKPAGLRIDLGGIGKGFIVDQVTQFLRAKNYTDFIVDAGGDLSAAGCDQTRKYPWWAIDIESPIKKESGNKPNCLLLSNTAVATSGINRRHWKKDGREHHHLIDTQKKTSAQTDLATVTVVTPTVVEADIWAKTLLILGQSQGLLRANHLSLAAFFIDQSGNQFHTSAMTQYLWKASSEKATFK